MAWRRIEGPRPPKYMAADGSTMKAKPRGVRFQYGIARTTPGASSMIPAFYWFERDGRAYVRIPAWASALKYKADAPRIIQKTAAAIDRQNEKAAR